MLTTFYSKSVISLQMLFAEERNADKYKAIGKENSGYISDLSLHLTNENLCSNEAFTTACQPVYYVCVKSENKAGLYSAEACSSPIRIVDKDKVGMILFKNLFYYNPYNEFVYA